MTPVLYTVENWLLAAVLAVMALLPLAEMALRSALQLGISGAASFTQHCALIASMMGAAIAAREQRLLSLSSVPSLLSGRRGLLFGTFARAVAVTVSALLALAGLQLVLVERAGGNVIAYGIPVWWAQLVLPAGFALIGLRLAWRAATDWRLGLALVALAAAVSTAAAQALALSDATAIAALGALLVAAVLGSPVFVTLGGAALFLFWWQGLPIAALPLDHYRMVVNPSLPMIPLFTLAGYFLAEGGASRRLLAVCDALFGGVRGGAAIAAVLSCAFFTSFSGASGVTIVALGGVLMPLLLGAGHSQKSALGLLTGAASIGGLLPPGLPLVLYAIVAKVPIEDMFLAGVVPGLLLCALVAAWAVRHAPPAAARPRRIEWARAAAAIGEAKWELCLPLVAFGGLFCGLATPVEAAALTAVYAFAIEVWVYRDLDLRRDVPRVMAECGLLVGGVLLVLGVALGFNNLLVDARIPELAVDWATGALASRWAFLAAMNAVLVLAGCLLDIFSAIVVLVPLLVPLGTAFGVDPLHLGIIFLVNMELGYLTPPVGMNLFFAAVRFGRPLPEVFAAAAPFAAVLAIAIFLVTCLPWIATALPYAVK